MKAANSNKAEQEINKKDMLLSSPDDSAEHKKRVNSKASPSPTSLQSVVVLGNPKVTEVHLDTPHEGIQEVSGREEKKGEWDLKHYHLMQPHTVTSHGFEE